MRTKKISVNAIKTKEANKNYLSGELTGNASVMSTGKLVGFDPFPRIDDFETVPGKIVAGNTVKTQTCDPGPGGPKTTTCDPGPGGPKTTTCDPGPGGPKTTTCDPGPPKTATCNNRFDSNNVRELFSTGKKRNNVLGSYSPFVS